jgi:polysaccharide biosynthesis transport protein
MSPTSSGHTPPPTVAGFPLREVHLLDRVAVLYRYRVAVVATFLAVIGWVMVDSYSTTPLYRASARLIVEEETAGTGAAGTDVAQSLVYEDPEMYLATQHRILKGRALARRVADIVKPNALPEFNGTAPPPSAIARTIDTVKTTVKRPFRVVFGATAPPVAVLSEPPAADEKDSERPYVDAIISRIEVTPIRGSRLVDVSFNSSDPKLAAIGVNTIAREFVHQNLEHKVQNYQRSLQWLATEVQRQALLVQQSDRALADYRERQNAVSLGAGDNIVTQRLNQLNDTVTRVRTERLQKEALWNQVREAGSNLETISAVVQNSFIGGLRQTLSDHRTNQSRLLDRYGPRHPDVVKVNAAIDDAERQLGVETQKAVRQIQNDYEALKAQERSLGSSLEEQKSAAMSLGRINIDYGALERQAESNQQVYNQLLQREKELAIIANSRANNIRIVDEAEVPASPYTPDHRRDWLVALVMAIALSFGVAFGLDYLDDTIKTPDDIARRLKISVLGVVPAIRGNRHPLLSGPVPHHFSESFRTLRTALVAQGQTGGPRVISVTSAQPLEGKTTTSVNIAMALAVGGARVLLIDADLRRPSVHKAMRLNNDRGLAQLLAGQARMREVVQRTHDPNLLVLPAGRTPSNPSELLASERMRALVEGLAEGPFDWAIIDTPPILAVTDAAIVAPLVDSVVFVVGSEMTRWPLAERAIQLLAQTNPRTILAVLNKVNYEKNRYYYSRYYGHQYTSYYTEAPAA